VEARAPRDPTPIWLKVNDVATAADPSGEWQVSKAKLAAGVRAVCNVERPPKNRCDVHGIGASGDGEFQSVLRAVRERGCSGGRGAELNVV